MTDILLKRPLNSKSSIHRVEENTEEIDAGGGEVQIMNWFP